MTRPARSSRSTSVSAKSSPLAPMIVALEPRRELPGDCRDPEPRKQRLHIAPPLELAALPPEHEEQRGRQRRGDGFGEKGADEKSEGEPVVDGPEGGATVRRSRGL